MFSKLYVNLRKPKNVINNINFEEGKVFEAFTSATSGYAVYYHQASVFRMIEILKRISVENLSAVDCEKLAKSVLVDL